MGKIIGLLGFINSGKGTVASTLVSKYNFRQDSFAASLKDACAVMFDWPRHLLEGDTKESREWREIVDPWWSRELNMPNFSPRLALQVIGTDALRNNFHQDLWFLTLRNRIRKNPSQSVVISDVRFPNEIKFIQEQGGTLIKVNRGPAPVWYETAVLANKGNSIAKEVMTKTYSDAHLSEWAWVGSKVDFEINNDTTLENLNLQITDLVKSISF
jgi:hypothetical protein